MNADEWKTVAEAARLLGKKSPVSVYEYLRKPQVETGIRRMTVGRKTMVHMPTLQKHEASVRPGRPRKADREEPQHETPGRSTP